MSTINTQLHILAFDDTADSNNPSLRAVDWKRSFLSVPCTNPVSQSKTIQPLATYTAFDASVITAIDGTTAFSLTISTLDSNSYFIKHTGGTAPAFRTNRAAVVSGGTITVTVSTNNLVTFTHSGTPFGSVVPGDTVFIPGLSTGDPAGVFNTLNEGLFTVVATTTAALTVARVPGLFSGVAEGPITISANSQFQVFSAAGVQVGDQVAISGSFQINARKTFKVLSVTFDRIEIQSTLALANETGITPNTNMKFFTAAKNFLYLEVDQEAVVRLNNDSNNSIEVSPQSAGDPNLKGVFLKHGNVWKLVIENKSTTLLKTVVITAEN